MRLMLNVNTGAILRYSEFSMATCNHMVECDSDGTILDPKQVGRQLRKLNRDEALELAKADLRPTRDEPAPEATPVIEPEPAVEPDVDEPEPAADQDA